MSNHRINYPALPAERHINETERAFENFCADPLYAEAAARGGIQFSLLKCAFMAGAKYAIDRCKAAGHPAIR